MTRRNFLAMIGLLPAVPVAKRLLPEPKPKSRILGLEAADLTMADRFEAYRVVVPLVKDSGAKPLYGMIELLEQEEAFLHGTERPPYCDEFTWYEKPRTQHPFAFRGLDGTYLGP